MNRSDSTAFGRRGQQLLMEYLHLQYPTARHEDTDGMAQPRLEQLVQWYLGDVWVSLDTERPAPWELKSEKQWTGNLFIELVHDVPTGMPGWFVHLRTDWLWYYFADTMTLVSLPFPALRAWLTPRLSRYREATQGRYEQRNVPLGRLVPVAHLLEALPGSTLQSLTHMPAAQALSAQVIAERSH